MKTAITILFLVFSFAGHSQNAKKMKDGNFQEINKAKDSTASGLTITTVKGVFPVYITPNKKMFYCTVSKSGKPYRKYLKVEGETKD